MHDPDPSAVARPICWSWPAGPNREVANPLRMRPAVHHTLLALSDNGVLLTGPDQF